MPAAHEPAVEVTGLTVRYGPEGQVRAVDGVDLVARAGEVLVVLGPNGAGKTSTIETLEGYRRPSGGRVAVLGLDPVADHHQLSLRMGVMLQKGGVYPMLAPRQVLDLFARYYPEPLGRDVLLDLVSLRSVATTPWRHLSGGEQQRLSLALALIGQPQVAFLDEPTAGVDPEGRQAIRAVVADLRTSGVCVVLTTHELDEAQKMADHVVIMAAGRVALEGTPDELTGAGGAAGLTFGAPAGLDVASLAAALGPAARVHETAAGRYRVEGVSGPDATAALATWLAARRTTLTDLVSGRTLEDVYFDAVGSAPVLVDEDPPEPAGARPGPGRRQRGRGRREVRR
jgi:ABC-2 type transport system ATP-binding protein